MRLLQDTGTPRKGSGQCNLVLYFVYLLDPVACLTVEVVMVPEYAGYSVAIGMLSSASERITKQPFRSLFTFIIYMLEGDQV